MDNAKKLGPNFPASVRFAMTRWLPSAEKKGFGIGLTREVAAATLGGKTKQNGTANGRRNSPMLGRKIVHHADDGTKHMQNIETEHGW